MMDHDPIIRDAFQEDVLPMAPTHQDRLWSAMQRRQARQIRRRYIARAGAVLLASAAVGGVIALRSVSRSSSSTDGRETGAIVIAADSLPNPSPAEPTMIQEQPPQPVPNLLPLLEYRNSLQMDITRYEAQIDALGRRLNQTSGAEHDVVSKQLRESEQQLNAARSALAVVDRELSGHPGPAFEYSSVPVTPPAPIVMGGPVVMPQDGLYMAAGLTGGLLLAILALLVYVRRIARATRESLAQVESQISSQHATLASGIDAIALEVERLGEGQRFMSRVLVKGEPQVRVGEATT